MRQTIATLLLLSCALFSGCAWSLGGSKAEHREHPTIGEELIDLKAAHKEGAVDDEEYAKLKTTLMDAAANR